MKHRRSLNTIALIVSIWVAASEISTAATDTKSVRLMAKIERAAKLIVESNTITFLNMNPDQTKQVPAVENDIKITVKVRTASTDPVTLSMIADGDLGAGSEIIPIENITWQAFGEGFISGTMSKSTVQKAGSWKASGSEKGPYNSI
jgi:hypothetical protein